MIEMEHQWVQSQGQISVLPLFGRSFGLADLVEPYWVLNPRVAVFKRQSGHAQILLVRSIPLVHHELGMPNADAESSNEVESSRHLGSLFSSLLLSSPTPFLVSPFQLLVVHWIARDREGIYCLHDGGPLLAGRRYVGRAKR